MVIFKVRDSKIEDIDFCFDLIIDNMSAYYKSNKKEIKKENLKKDFNPREYKIILLNKKRIGFYVLKDNSDCLYLDNLQIEKTFQLRGIGKELMKKIEKEAYKNENKKIRLKVFKNNVDAVNFYKKLSYKIVEDAGDSFIIEKITV